MRHYEMLGNGCIPYFLNIEKCPAHTMAHFPKSLCEEINSNVEHLKNDDLYNKFIDKFESHFLTYNTTEALAKYFINKIKTPWNDSTLLIL